MIARCPFGRGLLISAESPYQSVLSSAGGSELKKARPFTPWGFDVDCYPV